MVSFRKKLDPEIARRVPPGQRLVKTWPVLQYGPIPRFDEDEWDLRVFGEVEDPFTLTYAELKVLPTVTVDADMHCVTGWTTLDNAWTGVSFRTRAERPDGPHAAAEENCASRLCFGRIVIRRLRPR